MNVGVLERVLTSRLVRDGAKAPSIDSLGRQLVKAARRTNVLLNLTLGERLGQRTRPLDADFIVILVPLSLFEKPRQRAV